MTTLDFFTGVVLFGFVFGGYASGLIQSVGSVVGLLLGTVLAGRWYVAVAGWLAQFVGGQQKLAQVIAFALIVIVVARVFGLALAIFLKVFKVLTIVPGLKSLDKLGGTLFGAAEGALVIGLVFTVALSIFGNDFKKTLTASHFANTVQHIGKVLLPLVPKALKQVQGAIPNVNLDSGTLVNGAVNAVRDNPETFQGATQQLINSGVYR